MELKFVAVSGFFFGGEGSNRTFMELKLTLQGVGTNEVLVLIVPLWN